MVGADEMSSMDSFITNQDYRCNFTCSNSQMIEDLDGPKMCYLIAINKGVTNLIGN